MSEQTNQTAKAEKSPKAKAQQERRVKQKQREDHEALMQRNITAKLMDDGEMTDRVRNLTHGELHFAIDSGLMKFTPEVAHRLHIEVRTRWWTSVVDAGSEHENFYTGKAAK